MNTPVLPKLFPKILESKISPINGEIKVIQQFGQRKIVVGGLTQSGPVAEDVWRSGLQHINMLTCCKSTIETVLILGLGGGSLAKLINEYFPRVKIVGVEIDPIMIELGRKYLDLGKIKNLNVKVCDAHDFVKKTKQEFGLVFVDLYVGDKIPESCQTASFLENLRRIVKKDGVIVFNRLYYKNHIFEAKIFLDKLKKMWDFVSYKRVLTNLLIFAKDEGIKKTLG